MGIDRNVAKFLVWAHSLGVDFERTATLGRQELNLRPADVRASFSMFGMPKSDVEIRALFESFGGFAEGFVQSLGAEQVDSFDYSDYEGATHLQDMNDEISEDLHERYSVVFDGGALEHVFNFPVAIQNCMRMVEPGGHFLAITPTNNFTGHGFYQFSPELFFQTLCPTRGYEVRSMVAFTKLSGSRWYSVRRPEEVGKRVRLVNRVPTYLGVIARRLTDSKLLDLTPQQSDYRSAWDEAAKPSPASLETARPRVPSQAKRWFRTIFRSGFDRRFFQPIDIRRHRDL